MNHFPITQQNINNQAVSVRSARDLHSSLKVRRSFNAWIKRRIQQFGFIFDHDFVRVKGQSETLVEATHTRRSGGRGTIEYFFTLGAFEMLLEYEKTSQVQVAAARRQLVERDNVRDQREAPIPGQLHPTIRISQRRYIELLEAEIALLKSGDCASRLLDY